MNLMTLKIRTLITAFVILVLTGCGGGGGGISESGGSGVAAVGIGTAALSWLPPTENTDGSTLFLAGYNIYYGTEIGNYTEEVTIDNPGIASYVVENLPGGNTYYFVITAFDTDGNESGYSGVGSKTII